MRFISAAIVSTAAAGIVPVTLTGSPGEVGGVKEIPDDKSIYLLSEHPPTIPGIIRAAIIGGTGECRAYRDAAATIPASLPFSDADGVAIEGPILSFKCGPVVGSFPSVAPPPFTASITSSAVTSATSATSATSTFVTSTSIATPIPTLADVTMLGESEGALGKGVPLDGSVFVLSENPPTFSTYTGAELNPGGNGVGICRGYANADGTSPVGDFFDFDNPVDYSNTAGVVLSLKCWLERPNVLVSVEGEGESGATKTVPTNGSPFVLSANPPTFPLYTRLSIVQGDGVCRAYSDDAATVPVGPFFTLNRITEFDPAIAIASLRCRVRADFVTVTVSTEQGQTVQLTVPTDNSLLAIEVPTAITAKVTTGVARCRIFSDEAGTARIGRPFNDKRENVFDASPVAIRCFN